MSKRTGPNCILALLMVFAGAQAIGQSATSKGSIGYTVVVTGSVSSYEPDLGLVTIGDVSVYVGDLVASSGISVLPGDEILLIGTQADAPGLVLGIALEFINQPRPQSITGTGKKSITGTGKQSITGTGKQSITGTGASLQSITGTGMSAQSITGTGRKSITGTGKQSITGNGSSLQSITGTGKSAQSITGTGKASITGTGSR